MPWLTKKYMNKKIIKVPDLKDFLKEELKDKESKRMYEEFGRQFEVAYQINHLRRQKKMSQAVFAKKLGTTQSNIARLETGNQNFTVQFLGRIADVLGAELKIALK
jgi:DNA-binding transcriptional regulator YiaG